MGAFTLMGANRWFDLWAVCRPVQEERSLYQGSWLPLLFVVVVVVASCRSRVTCPPACPIGPLELQLASKCCCLLMIIDAACLLNVLSGWLSICSALTRVTERCPACTPVVMNPPQQQPCHRNNIIRHPALLLRRKQIMFQSFLKSFVRKGLMRNINKRTGASHTGSSIKH